MAFKRVPRWKKHWVNSIMSGRSPPLYCTLKLIAMQGHQKIVVSIVLILHWLLVGSKYSVQNSSVTFTKQTVLQTVLHTRSEGSNDTVKTSSVLERVGMMSDSICTGSDAAPTLHSCGSGQRVWGHVLLRALYSRSSSFDFNK